MLSYKHAFKLITQRKIRADKLISGEALQSMRHNGYITTRTIDKLCAALNCQPGDLMEYVPDEPGSRSAGEPEEEKQ